LSIDSSDTQFWSAISMFSCMTIFTPSTFSSVLFSWSIWDRSSYLAQSLARARRVAAPLSITDAARATS